MIICIYELHSTLMRTIDLLLHVLACRVKFGYFISMRHTALAKLRSGHLRVNYWKRIRSRTWTNKITPVLGASIIIIVVINISYNLPKV